MKSHKNTVAVGMSGGVDSSVAAGLLVKSGYNVVGITMEIWDGAINAAEKVRHACYGPGEQEDIEAAREVAGKLGFPFFPFDLRKEYRTYVLDYFRAEYLKGRTPNPCVACNQRVKFGFLVEKALQSGLDFNYFATGHYARIVREGDKIFLKRALDLRKDQSYFLSGLRREQLMRTLFPVGELAKAEVRKIAGELGLSVAKRPESQDFIGGGDYSCLFDSKEVKAGTIVDENENILGKHQGITNYTIGQRKRIGVSSQEPLYVLKIDAEKNRIVVGKREKLMHRVLVASEVNWIIKPDEASSRVKAKIRQQHKEAPALVEALSDGTARCVFDEPQLAITPGQTVVFYDGDIVLGGGVISGVES